MIPSPTRPAPAWARALGAALLLAALVPAPAARAEEAAAPVAAKKKQEIIFPEIRTHTVSDQPFGVAARATSNLPVSLQLVAGPAVLEKNELRLTGVTGLVVLRATQDGDKAFLPAKPVDRIFEVVAVPQAPGFEEEPQSTTVAVGDTLHLSVRATGEPRPALQWRRDGTPIPGATAPVLMLPSVGPSVAGTYDVVATNEKGTRTSGPARVTVGRRSQTIFFITNQTTYTPSQPLTLRATASSGLPVHLEVLSGSATMMGDQLVASFGTVTVRATQPGDSVFDAAAPVLLSLQPANAPVMRFP